MRRREVITLLGGAAVLPLAARAQQPGDAGFNLTKTVVVQFGSRNKAMKALLPLVLALPSLALAKDVSLKDFDLGALLPLVRQQPRIRATPITRCMYFT